LGSARWRRRAQLKVWACRDYWDGGTGDW